MTPTDDPFARPTPKTATVIPFEPVAWRAPAATRFDSRPANDVMANDFLARADRIAPRTLGAKPVEAEPFPRWLTFVIGAVIAALLGALLGGAMSV